jgi:hypothetical protein
VLTDANLFGWSWRAVFFVNAPVALLVLSAGSRLVPETRDPAAGRPNLPAAAVLAAGLTALALSVGCFPGRLRHYRSRRSTAAAFWPPGGC